MVQDMHIRVLYKALALLAFLFLPAMSQAAGVPVSPSERAQVFATCHGRLAAEMDHQRLMGDHPSQQIEHRHSAFKQLYQAVLPDALEYGLPGALAVTWFNTAKRKQAWLLMRADFNGDTDIKQKSRDAARALLSECDSLLLG